MCQYPASEEKRSFSNRARSVPYRGAFVGSVALCAIVFTCIIGVVAAGVSLALERNLATGLALAGFMLAGALFWILSYLKRREAMCPLCRGTPLLDNRAHHHPKAVRFGPINYGITNVIRIMATLQFRCHLCGTPFDILKEVRPAAPTPRPAEVPATPVPDFTKPSPVAATPMPASRG